MFLDDMKQVKPEDSTYPRPPKRVLDTCGLALQITPVLERALAAGSPPAQMHKVLQSLTELAKAEHAQRQLQARSDSVKTEISGVRQSSD